MDTQAEYTYDDDHFDQGDIPDITDLDLPCNHCGEPRGDNEFVSVDVGGKCRLWHRACAEQHAGDSTLTTQREAALRKIVRWEIVEYLKSDLYLRNAILMHTDLDVDEHAQIAIVDDEIRIVIDSIQAPEAGRDIRAVTR